MAAQGRLVGLKSRGTRMVKEGRGEGEAGRVRTRRGGWRARAGNDREAMGLGALQQGSSRGAVA